MLKRQKKKNNKAICLNIQKQLLDISKDKKLTKSYKHLLHNIDRGISQLHIELLNKEKQRDKNQLRKLYNKVEWLLVTPKTHWSSRFKNYQKNLSDTVCDWEKIDISNYNNDKFYQQVLKDIKNQQKNSQKFPEYESIAKLYKKAAKKAVNLYVKAQSYELAGLFYQLSRGKVPPYIYDIVAEEKPTIIKLTKDERSNLAELFYKKKTLGIGLVCSMIMLLLALILLDINGINNIENNPNKPQQKLNLDRRLDREFYYYGKSGSEESKQEIIDLIKDINKYYFEGNTNNNEPSYTVKKARNFISNSLTIQSKLLKEDKVSFPINNDSEKATKEQLQLMLYGLGFYETKNDRAKFNQREFWQIVNGNLGCSTAKALNQFTEKYPKFSQIFPECKEQPNLESVNVEVDQETWELLHKLYLEEPVKVATNLLLNSFQSKTDPNEIIKDINQLISCRKKASSIENTSKMYISYLNCVDRLINTDNKAQAGN